ncbi:hypothetical protein ACFL03_08800 [Thermodesulfobacteriota bacterium]
MAKKLNDLQNLPPDELIKLCLDGDKPAWNEFFRRYTNFINQQTIKVFVFYSCLDLAKDTDVIHDVYEQIVIKLYKKNALSQLKDPDKLIPWLKTVVRNKTKDWVGKYLSKKNLPERQAEHSTKSLETPIGKDGARNYIDILPHESECDAETQMKLKKLLIAINKLRNEELWVFRLKLLFYNPLDKEEIKQLEQFTGKPYKRLKTRLDEIMEKLLKKKNKKEQDLQSSSRVWSLIRYLETALLKDLKEQSFSDDERRERESEIDRRRKRMEALLRSAEQFIEPSNEEVADILDLEVGQVSVLRHRARKKLRSMNENGSAEKRN